MLGWNELLFHEMYARFFRILKNCSVIRLFYQVVATIKQIIHKITDLFIFQEVLPPQDPETSTYPKMKRINLNQRTKRN